MPTHNDQLLTSTVPDDPSRRQFIGAAVTAGLASACVSQETGSENAIEPKPELQRLNYRSSMTIFILAFWE